MRAASHVIVVVPCAKCACRWRTSGASISAVGERDRLEQLLDVDLARAAEAACGGRGTPGANGGPRARARPRAAGGARSASARAGTRARSRAAPEMERLASAPSGRAGTRASPRSRRATGWSVPRSRSSTGLMTNSRSGTPACSTRWISRRDERLGDPREPHQDVADGPVHNPVTTQSRNVIRHKFVKARFRGHGFMAAARGGRGRSAPAPVRGVLPRRRRRLGGRAAAGAARPLRRARAAARPRGDPARAGRAGWRASSPRAPRAACTSTATRTRTTSARGASASSARRAGSRAQRRDIAAGRARLRELLGDRRRPDLHAALEPLHGRHGRVPRRARLPRCSRASRARSRSAVAGLASSRSTSTGSALALARGAGHAGSPRAIEAGGPVGVMFHHAVMEPRTWPRVRAARACWRATSGSAPERMRELARASVV